MLNDKDDAERIISGFMICGYSQTEAEQILVLYGIEGAFSRLDQELIKTLQQRYNLSEADAQQYFDSKGLIKVLEDLKSQPPPPSNTDTQQSYQSNYEDTNDLNNSAPINENAPPQSDQYSGVVINNVKPSGNNFGKVLIGFIVASFAIVVLLAFLANSSSQNQPTNVSTTSFQSNNKMSNANVGNKSSNMASNMPANRGTTNTASPNANQTSNSSQVATTTPLQNPLVESTPEPLDDPETSYKETRVSIVRVMSEDMGRFTDDYSIRDRYFSFDVITREISSCDDSLKKIIYSSDKESLKIFTTFISKYLESVDEESYAVRKEYDVIAIIKYKNQLLPKEAPENQDLFEEGNAYKPRKITQLAEMLKSISATSKGITRENLMEQYKDQLNYSIQISQQKVKKADLKRRETTGGY